MIKNKLLLVALIATSILLPAAVRAGGIQIQIGDRPFYNHGARYWDGDYEMVWVPGHRQGIIGFTANMSAGNSVGTTGKTVMMIDKTIIATTIADKTGR
jgi:hypothetical protein